jgi:hypothetical protein
MEAPVATSYRSRAREVAEGAEGAEVGHTTEITEVTEFFQGFLLAQLFSLEARYHPKPQRGEPQAVNNAIHLALIPTEEDWCHQ